MVFLGQLLEDAAWVPCPGHYYDSQQNLCVRAVSAAHVRRRASGNPLRKCEQCGELASRGELGKPGTRFVGRWFCHVCWRRWAHKIPFERKADVAAGVGPNAPRAGSAFAKLGHRVRCRDCCSSSASVYVRIDLLEGYRGRRLASTEGREEDWVCPQCWLSCPRAPDPQQELARISCGFEVLQQVMLLRAAAHAAACDEAEPTEKSEAPPERVGDQPWPHDNLLVVWDALDRNAAAIAHVLHDEFSPFLRCVELHDEQAVEAELAAFPGVPREEVVREGGLSAILPDGIFIHGCEDQPKVLLYELKYLLTVRRADPEETARFELEILEGLALIRNRNFTPLRGNVTEAEAGVALRRWWACPDALRLVSRSLAEHKMCLLDGFVSPAELRQLQETALLLHQGGHMELGIVEQRQGERSYFGEEAANEGDFLNIADKPRKWTVQGDQRIWIKDTDARAGHLLILTCALDRLVTQMRREEGVDPKTAKRLRRIAFRENTMVACYEGGARGRYLKHCDTGRKAVLTAIFYLNDSWCTEDGGMLRLFHDKCPTRVRYDVAPLANRLLLFWSTDECPHEVRAAHRDRYAMTVWFLDARQHIDTEGGSTGDGCDDGSVSRPSNLLHNANIVASDTDDEFLLSCPPLPSLLGHVAVDTESAKKLRIAIGRQAQAEAEAKGRNCAGCGTEPLNKAGGPDNDAAKSISVTYRAAATLGTSGVLGTDGRMGDAEYEDNWYCQGCWDKWEEDWREESRVKKELEARRQAEASLWRVSSHGGSSSVGALGSA